MKQEPCTYLPESAADCLPILSSDTRQSSLWSGSHTHVKSYESEPKKDGSPTCQCGKGTLDCSIHPSTPEKWTLSMRDSLAKTLALLESRQVYLREPEVGFTAKSCVSLASLSHDKSFWKTSQQSFLTDSEPYSQTWPRWGMTQGGFAYAHPMSERRITETGGSYLPTPLAIDGTASGAMERTHKSGAFWNLKDWYHQKMKDLYINGRVRSRQRNAEFWGWLMGMPANMARLKATETLKSRCKPQPLTDFSEDNKK